MLLSSSSLSYLDHRVGPLLATRSLTPPRWPCLPCSMDEDCSWCKIDGIYPCLEENGKTSLCEDSLCLKLIQFYLSGQHYCKCDRISSRCNIDFIKLEEACRVSNIEQSADDDNYNFLSEPVSDD